MIILDSITWIDINISHRSRQIYGLIKKTCNGSRLFSDPEKKNNADYTAIRYQVKEPTDFSMKRYNIFHMKCFPFMHPQSSIWIEPNRNALKRCMHNAQRNFDSEHFWEAFHCLDFVQLIDLYIIIVIVFFFGGWWKIFTGKQKNTAC